MTQIETARTIATRAHEGQVDKIGAPYIDHPAQVVDLVQRLPGYAEADEDVQRDAVVAAWLHDVVEDTPVTAADLTAAGFTARAVDAVVALTRTDDVPPDDYYAHVRETPVARLVKTADIASNLDPRRTAQLDDAKRDELARKYAHALDALGVDRSVVDALHA
ncbi:HD domain-containing protein [Rhodococcus aerolatus]